MKTLITLSLFAALFSTTSAFADSAAKKAVNLNLNYNYRPAAANNSNAALIRNGKKSASLTKPLVTEEKNPSNGQYKYVPYFRTVSTGLSF